MMNAADAPTDPLYVEESESLEESKSLDFYVKPTDFRNGVSSALGCVGSALTRTWYLLIVLLVLLMLTTYQITLNESMKLKAKIRDLVENDTSDVVADTYGNLVELHAEVDSLHHLRYAADVELVTAKEAVEDKNKDVIRERIHYESVESELAKAREKYEYELSELKHANDRLIRAQRKRDFFYEVTDVTLRQIRQKDHHGIP
jgi:hypothetical protein